jgi:hypothetical protein
MSDGTDQILGRLELAITTGFAAVHGRIDQLDHRMDKLDQRMDKLDGQMIQIRTDVMERIDRLQNTLTGLRSDMLVNYGATERVSRSQENSDEQRRLLQDQVNLMHKRILGIDERVRNLEEKG